MASVWGELKRRNVIRMAMLYVIAAWVIVQVAEVLNGLTNLPDWVGPIILGLLAVGFPIALILSWFFEITPAGVSLEKDVDRAVSITQMTGRRLDFIVISLLSAGLILFAYDKWWMDGPPECPSSNKWNRRSAFLKESFAHQLHIMRRVVDSANDVSRWSFS